GPRMRLAVSEVAAMLGAGVMSDGRARFTGPVEGSRVDQELLARGCWVLALATEVFRSAAAMGPLTRFHGGVTARDLLGLAPPAGLAQLAGFRHVFESTLITRLAARTGPWTLGPVFTGSVLLAGPDGDLIAAGLLLDLKTSAKLTLTIKDLWQALGYALLDFDDDYGLDSAAIFSARYAYLATWDLAALLSDLAGHQVSLQSVRDEFHKLLHTHSA
ncbi:MAG: hypothetical protein ACRDNZ_16970, partial [Streptosporangiaceae bacterium]